ncbi:DUF1127 domain-containing protein [Hoeflea prorocentri]|uniref:DUF1127 domain-containing protein n=1 Tax=Hoeflea prorocentri TaxID=1922333 RepID=A0A9X3UJ68_9HYPH|nr:DUF1127 domain-containing protein [Hoeflea prorocentri]MCY6382337.1 DUF1127 domain-containing protein [Hoeflea prorocentri]MDA5400137.1 DUF1127 domain-containing protein [Hoeflea prorocentri]
MTSINRALDIQAAGKRGSAWTTARKAIVSLFVRYRNRRQVMGLSDFNDHMLDDIGISRDDLRHALRGGPFDDNSMDLMRAALRRRSQLTLL